MANQHIQQSKNFHNFGRHLEFPLKHKRGCLGTFNMFSENFSENILEFMALFYFVPDFT